MQLSTMLSTLLLAIVPCALASCNFREKTAGIQKEIDTISSHTNADANKIPLAPLATRTFLITRLKDNMERDRPAELGGDVTLPPVNVGVTADTVRLELVELGTALQAGVPAKSVHYIENKNGSVTVDFIQTDDVVLPRVHVREIHYFNSKCQITQILGYVNGAVECPQPAKSSNPVIKEICGLYANETKKHP